MKEPRASHFWSQELKDHVINSGWLSVCWSSLPEGLNILPDRLWWLLYMLFIMLQFGTHKAATWSSLWTLAEQSFLNTTAAGLFRGAEQCWGPISIHIIPCFYLGIATADWSCRVQGVHVHAVKVKIIFLFSACLALLAVDLDGPSPPLFNTYRLFWVRAAGPTRAIHSSSGLWAWFPIVKWLGLGMCEFLSVPLARIIASRVLRSQQDLWSCTSPL